MEDYEKSNFYCPLCGQKEVWRQEGMGDYYNGSDYICIYCGGQSLLDGCYPGPNQINYMNKLEQLKTGVTMEPTTKRGK